MQETIVSCLVSTCEKYAKEAEQHELEIMRFCINNPIEGCCQYRFDEIQVTRFYRHINTVDDMEMRKKCWLITKRMLEEKPEISSEILVQEVNQ